MAKPTVWVREATGILRGVSPSTMFWANMGEIGFGTGLLFFNILWSSAVSSIPGGLNPNEMGPAIGVFTVVVLFEAYIFYHVTHTIGRTGGDYVWLSRTIGPTLAGFLLLGFVWTGIPFLAIQLNWLVTVALAPSLTTIAIVTGNAGLTAAITGLSAATSITAIGLAILVVIVAIDIVSPRNGFRLLALMVILATLGTLAMAAVFVSAGPSGIHSSLDAYMKTQGSSFAALGSQPPPAFSYIGILLLLPFIAFFLPWINNVAAFGGELRNIKRSALYATFAVVLVSGGLLMLFNQIYISYLGVNYAYGAASQYLNMLTVATIAAGNNPLLIYFMNITFALWYIAALQQTVLVVSRYFLGMSFDRLLPVQLSSVSDRFHSPTVALITIGVLAAIMIPVVNYTTWLSVYSTTALGTMYFAFVGITALIYAVRKRGVLKRVWGPMIVSGVIMAVFFAVITFMLLFVPYYGITTLNPGLALSSGVLPWFAIIIAFWVVGGLLYTISKAYYKRKGIDVSLTYKEIPPE